MAKNPTTRNACFTSFNVDKLIGLKENLDPNLVDYCIWQVERCPETDRLHIQGYLELKKPARFTGIKKILGDNSAHIEPRRGTRTEARDYCRKIDTRVEGPYEFGTWREQTQGKRSDLDSVYDMVRSGKTQKDILEDQPSTFIKFNRGIREAIWIHNCSNAKTRQREIYVELYYGDPGTGKTRDAFNKYRGIYILTRGSGSNVWWDGYEGEESILLDDFYGWVPFHLLLQYLDRYPVRLEIKGSHAWANWDHVIITSNKPYGDWYTDTKGDIRALERRIHRIIRYESDGSRSFEKEERVENHRLTNVNFSEEESDEIV